MKGVKKPMELFILTLFGAVIIKTLKKDIR
jgi:hypothetical protein